MRSTRFVPTLIAACLVASASCSDATAPTSPRRVSVPTTALTTLDGVIHLSPTKSNGIVLSLADGGEVTLDGPEAGALTNLENAEVEVSGQWSDDTFLVGDFLVRQVDGVDVLDGVLLQFFGDEIDSNFIGYGLRLTRGSLVPLMDPPADLIAHVGDRVWVAESADGQTSAFGIIGR